MPHCADEFKRELQEAFAPFELRTWSMALIFLRSGDDAKDRQIERALERNSQPSLQGVHGVTMLYHPKMCCVIRGK